MKGPGSYVPPTYIPLNQEDTDVHNTHANGVQYHQSTMQDPTQWSSGICACFDDMQSCCVGTVCPCFLFGKNAEFLGSGTLAGSCTTHFILWGLVNSLCCLFTGGLLAGVPGSMVACYACGHRKTLRAKYNLQSTERFARGRMAPARLWHSRLSLLLQLRLWRTMGADALSHSNCSFAQLHFLGNGLSFKRDAQSVK